MNNNELQKSHSGRLTLVYINTSETKLDETEIAVPNATAGGAEGTPPSSGCQHVWCAWTYNSHPEGEVHMLWRRCFKCGREEFV